MIRSLQFAVQLDHWTFGSRLDARPQASSHPLLTNFLFGDIVCAVLKASAFSSLAGFRFSPT